MVEWIAAKMHFIKVHMFWEGHKILRNIHRGFDRYNIALDKSTVEILQKNCGLLRIYEP